MTDAQRVLWEMLHQGPYAAQDQFGGIACGFCAEYPPYHSYTCPWPTFRDNILQAWPEWSANLNGIDMQERLDREAAAKAAWVEV